MCEAWGYLASVTIFVEYKCYFSVFSWLMWSKRRQWECCDTRELPFCNVTIGDLLISGNLTKLLENVCAVLRCNSNMYHNNGGN